MRSATARHAHRRPLAFLCTVALALFSAVPGSDGTANAASPETLEADLPDGSHDEVALRDAFVGLAGSPRRRDPDVLSLRAPGPQSRVNLAPRSPPLG